MNLIKNYVEHLSDSDLIFLYERLTDNYQDDLCDVFNFVSGSFASLLQSSKCYKEIYKNIDDLESSVNKEIIKRKIVIAI